MFRIDLSDGSSEWEYLGLAEPEVNFGIRTFYLDNETGTMYAGFFEYNWDGPGLFKSINDGENWNYFTAGISNRYEGRSAFLTKLTAPKDNASNVFAGTWGALFKLKEDTTGWKYLDDNNEIGKGIFSISFNPNNSQQIWVGGRSGFETPKLLKSIDGGNDWEDKTGNISEFTQLLDEVNAITFHPKNPDIIYVCLSRKIIKTMDGGNNWRQLDSDLNGENEFNDPDLDKFTYFKDLSINPANPKEMLAAGKFLYYSKDEGITWEVIPDTTRSGFIDLIVNWENRTAYTAPFRPEQGIYKLNF
jgi:photosystem II stability/assembly factor-like uncharacterized protein